MTGQAVVTDWDVAEVEWTMSHGESRTDVMLRLGPLGVWFSPDGKWFAGNEVVTAVRPLRLIPVETADQSQSQALRDGLAGSDEAVALMRGRLRARAASSGILGEGPEMVDAFEAAVRAEAVADERRNAVAQVRHDLALLADRVEDYTAQGLRDRLSLYGDQLSRSLAAGSVPVVTPEPPCDHGHSEAHWATGTNQFGYGSASSWCAGPVATPAETVESMCHWTQGRGNARAESHEEFHYGSPCPYESMAAVLRGEPDPRDVDCDHGGSPGVTVCRYCAPDEARDEDECTRARCVQIAATASEVYCDITGGALSYPTYDARTILAHANDETNKLVESETAELRAEVARYRAAIDKVRELHSAVPMYQVCNRTDSSEGGVAAHAWEAPGDGEMVCGPQVGTQCEHCQSHDGPVDHPCATVAILAAALGDGE